MAAYRKKKKGTIIMTRLEGGSWIEIVAECP